MTGIRPYLLRFWESEFEDIQPILDPEGNKFYSQRDLELLKKVKGLLLEDKLTIERARHMLEREKAGLGNMKTAFVTRFQKSEVNAAGLQAVQERAMVRGRAEIPVVPVVPAVAAVAAVAEIAPEPIAVPSPIQYSLLEKTEELSRLKANLELMIVEIELKKKWCEATQLR